MLSVFPSAKAKNLQTAFLAYEKLNKAITSGSSMTPDWGAKVYFFYPEI